MIRSDPKVPIPPIGDRSYGAIALRYQSSLHLSSSSAPTTKNTELLLIHQKTVSSKFQYFWCFPKGHAEHGDASALHTAIRELREETGLVVTLDDVLDLQESNGDSLDLKERYLNPVKKVGKEVRYWVVLVTGEQATRELRLQTKEVNDSRWCGWDEAESLVTFEETRAMLKSVREAMERKEGKDKEGAGEREGKL